MQLLISVSAIAVHKNSSPNNSSLTRDVAASRLEAKAGQHFREENEISSLLAHQVPERNLDPAVWKRDCWKLAILRPGMTERLSARP